ncbi:hypothetical protein DFH08DRAFT_955947 [Mycena albidolilacea]|uniref:F-box domain-containing protein n=1 Tax=Mycena albidolilacea TaxID=1033008 RepID=A0AAD7AC33_9AGAR|nr:hypothetical protein DFH08DRAFT_955947 [Mycena albidolilacea]
MQRNFMASPFAAQLGTNYCPKDKEVLEIQTLLVKPALRLKNLDNEIAELQKAIEKLMEERDGLGAYVDAHKALISPVRRLPLDIIEEIFVTCLPTHRNCVMSASEAPVLLGRVCSSWRAISLSTPRLWAKIHVVEPESDPYSRPAASFDQKVAQRVQVTKMWLGRSGQCPLSISLESAPENSPPETEVSSAASLQFLQVLVPFAPRWQHIHFATPATYILEIISHLDVDMPWLETVAFHHQASRSLDNIDWGHFSIFRGARISSVSIPGRIFIPERFPVLWDQLTTLTIGGPSWSVDLTSEVIFRVISGCPELRCCKVVVRDNLETEMSTAPPQHSILELQFLHTLAIHCVGDAAPVVSLLLKRLSVPELSNFIFFGSRQDSPPLSDFLTRSLCLRSLEINNHAFSKTSVLDTLGHLPSTVRQLKIIAPEMAFRSQECFDDDALAVLTSPGLCPALRDLSIGDSHHYISDAAVLRFITARMMLEPRALKSVEICFGRPMTLDIMPDLLDFIENGLAISLTYTPSPRVTSPWKGLPDAPAVAYPTWTPPNRAVW